MKTNILVTGLVLATIGTVLVYPTLRGHATASTHIVVPPPSAAKRVEVVFVLDTTGSMGGLIETAKEKIWSIASTLAQAHQTPEISMGLVAYRDHGDAYVTRVIDLDRDLDSMYAKLMDFAADGGGDGPEAVNEALQAAVERVSWSQDPGTYKVVFLVGDAPPHMDYQDVKYPQVVAAAAARGIVINTIQCGSMGETVAPWQQIAALGRGHYFTVEQAGGAVAVATPFDEQIATLAAQLDDTRLYYGSSDEVAQMADKIAATTRLNEEASVSARARRGVFNVSEAGVAGNFLGGRELVDDVASGRVDLDAVPAAELPATVAAAPPEARQAMVEATAQKREELQREIAKLGAERDAFIEAEVERNGGAEGSLDQQIYEAVRDQAADVGIVYDGGPKF
jgi:uncharacterized protein YegL